MREFTALVIGLCCLSPIALIDTNRPGNFPLNLPLVQSTNSTATSFLSSSTNSTTTILPTTSTTTSDGGAETGVLSAVNLLGILGVVVGVAAALALIRRRAS